MGPTGNRCASSTVASHVLLRLVHAGCEALGKSWTKIGRPQSTLSFSAHGPNTMCRAAAEPIMAFGVQSRGSAHHRTSRALFVGSSQSDETSEVLQSAPSSQRNSAVSVARWSSRQEEVRRPKKPVENLAGGNPADGERSTSWMIGSAKEGGQEWRRGGDFAGYSPPSVSRAKASNRLVSPAVWMQRMNEQEMSRQEYIDKDTTASCGEPSAKEWVEQEGSSQANVERKIGNSNRKLTAEDWDEILLEVGTH